MCGVKPPSVSYLSGSRTALCTAAPTGLHQFSLLSPSYSPQLFQRDIHSRRYAPRSAVVVFAQPFIQKLHTTGGIEELLKNVRLIFINMKRARGRGLSFYQEQESSPGQADLSSLSTAFKSFITFLPFTQPPQLPFCKLYRAKISVYSKKKWKQPNKEGLLPRGSQRTYLYWD